MCVCVLFSLADLSITFLLGLISYLNRGEVDVKIVTFIYFENLSSMLRRAVNGAQQLRHVVLFKFKDTASPNDIAKIEREFRALATTKVPQVRSFESGTHVGKERFNQGYTHGFLLTFDNEEDRDTYMAHDDHKAFVRLQQGIVDQKIVLAFWGK